MPNMRGEFRLAFDQPANGSGTTAQSCAAPDRCAPGRARSEALPLRFRTGFYETKRKAERTTAPPKLVPHGEVL